MSPLCAHVLFDLDGVLVDTVDAHYFAWSRVAGELGVSFTREDNDALRGVRRDIALTQYLATNRSLEPEEKDRLLKLKATAYKEIIHKSGTAIRVPGVDHLLEGLRAEQIKIAVASASRHAHELLRLAELEQWVDIVSGGDQNVAPKPSPDQLLSISRELRADPSTCLVVEDAAVGIEAARRAEMRALAVGPNLKDEPLSVPWISSLRNVDVREFWQAASEKP
ncbi:MAG: HAD-IA family hydrolase [Myxococcota bacterium]